MHEGAFGFVGDLFMSQGSRKWLRRMQNLCIAAMPQRGIIW
jgi:hypothetical protein